MRATGLLVLSLALVGVPGIARAGGMEVGDTGAEALARGGAFVAKADNPTAINYNPAGFVKLRGHHIATSANAVHWAYDFTRTGSVGGNPYPTASGTEPWFAAPLHLMATTDLGYFDRITLAAGFYAPAALGRGYAAETDDGSGNKTPAPQRYDFVEMGGLMLFPSVALAFRPTRWLDIGLSFQWAVSKVTATNYAMVSDACDTTEDPSCDIVMEIEAQDLFAPSGSAGVLVRPGRNLELGALLRLPSKSELEGNAKVTVGSGLKRLESYVKYPMMDPEEPPITITNAYPLMFRLGARYIFLSGDEERADIEANFVFENWAAVSKRSVTIHGLSLGKPIGEREMDSRLKNTFGFRLGGSYRFRLARNAELILRAGSFFETESTEVSDTSLQVLGPRRIGVTGGVGLRWGFLALDAAYAHLFVPTRVVNQSTVTAQDFKADGNGPVVGNGTYSASVDMLSVQLTVSFGGIASGRAPAAEPAVRYRPEPEATDVLGFNVDGKRKVRRRVARARRAAPAPQPEPEEDFQFEPELISRTAAPAISSPQPLITRPKLSRKRYRKGRSYRAHRLRAASRAHRLHKQRKLRRAKRRAKLRRAKVRRNAAGQVVRWRKNNRPVRCLRRDADGRCVAYKRRGRRTRTRISLR